MSVCLSQQDGAQTLEPCGTGDPGKMKGRMTFQGVGASKGLRDRSSSEGEWQ